MFIWFLINLYELATKQDYTLQSQWGNCFCPFAACFYLFIYLFIYKTKASGGHNILYLLGSVILHKKALPLTQITIYTSKNNNKKREKIKQ